MTNTSKQRMSHLTGIEKLFELFLSYFSGTEKQMGQLFCSIAAQQVHVCKAALQLSMFLQLPSSWLPRSHHTRSMLYVT